MGDFLLSRICEKIADCNACNAISLDILFLSKGCLASLGFTSQSEPVNLCPDAPADAPANPLGNPLGLTLFVAVSFRVRAAFSLDARLAQLRVLPSSVFWVLGSGLLGRDPSGRAAQVKIRRVVYIA